MNRKLHNSVTALFATTGLLVLSLMAANPVRTQSDAIVAPVVQQQVPVARVQPVRPAQLAVEARHAIEAAKRIEARAAVLEVRLEHAKNAGDALGQIVGFAAEAATLASIAAAMDGMEATDSVIADNAIDGESSTPPARKRAHGRQSVAMPFFSFAPRG
jgi:hypothetical protein